MNSPTLGNQLLTPTIKYVIHNLLYFTLEVKHKRKRSWERSYITLSSWHSAND